jgi:hypothetical protein
MTKYFLSISIVLCELTVVLATATQGQDQIVKETDNQRTHVAAISVAEEGEQDVSGQFAQSEQKNGSISLYWLNSKLDKETLKQQIELLRQNGFSGVAPLPRRGQVAPEYLSHEYLEIYQFMLDELAARNMELMFYDDCDFPTGTAGGRMKTAHPEKLIKYLTRVDAVSNGGEPQTIAIPNSNNMSFCKLASACVSKTGETKFESIQLLGGSPLRK